MSIQEYAVEIDNLSKIYKLYNAPIDRMKEALHWRGKKYHKDFYALNNISFTIKKGETVGVVGKNGSGKSTLLKIITGVLTPTSGSSVVNGKVSALLELGAGFNPEYTGIENVLFQGNLMGYSTQEMESKLPEILDFADIGDFVYQPVKSYSSGMFARLAFAVAINVDPDILIVDEALSVGDVAFQNKCMRKMERFVAQSGKTIIFVSHDVGAMRKFCNKIIWLHEGVVKEVGGIEVLKDYLSFMVYGLVSSKQVNGQKLDKHGDKLNLELDNAIKWINVEDNEAFCLDGGTRISDIALFSRDKNEYTNVVITNESLTLFVKLRNNHIAKGLAVGLNWADKLNNIIFTVNNYMYEQDLDEIGETGILKIDFILPQLCVGDYIISIACAEGTQHNHIQHHWIHFGTSVRVISEENPLITSSAKIWLSPQQVGFVIGS